MASVYILYSKSADSFYIGSCYDIKERLQQHFDKTYKGFTSTSNDWELFYSINDLDYQQARRIEAHIKQMKSRTYLKNLFLFPEISNKLILKYK